MASEIWFHSIGAINNIYRVYSSLVESVMTQEQDKFQKVQTKIEKTINPFISLKIPIPDNVDEDAFMSLEKDPEFLEWIKKQIEFWLNQRKGQNQS